MRESRFTQEQMVKMPSRSGHYVWRQRFGAMTADEAKRMKALEVENGELKKMLPIEVLK